MKKRSLSPKQKQIRNYTLGTLVVLSALSPLALVQKSQSDTVANLTYRALLNKIDQQQNQQKVNTYGFWQNDPKLDLFYGQDANLNANALTKVNYHSFAYNSEPVDATVDLEGQNTPSLRIITTMGYQVDRNTTMGWSDNINSPIYNPSHKIHNKVIRKISETAKLIWNQVYPELDVDQKDPFYQEFNQFINQLGGFNNDENRIYLTELYQILGAIGSQYVGELNLWGHEGWTGEWIAYDGRDSDPEYQSHDRGEQWLVKVITKAWDKSTIKNQFFSQTKNTFVDYSTKKNTKLFRTKFIGPFLNQVANLAPTFVQTNESDPNHVLFPYLRKAQLAISGFDPLKTKTALVNNVVQTSPVLSDQEKSLLATLLEKKLSQISQLIPIDWNQWVEQQAGLLKDPDLISALQKNDSQAANKIIDKFIANFQNSQSPNADFNTTKKRVLSQNLDRHQEAISFVFDKIMLNQDRTLLDQLANLLLNRKDFQLGAILINPWINVDRSVLINFLTTKQGGINYLNNQPLVLQNLWIATLASNWKIFANSQQIKLISKWADFAINQPDPEWKTHQQQYLIIAKMLYQSFPLPTNFDGFLQQGTIVYQQVLQRLKAIQQTVQDQYSTTGTISADLQTIFNQEAQNLINIENKTTVIGALVNLISTVSEQNFNQINNQSDFDNYLSIKYGSGQDLIERISQLQVVLQERFNSSREWVINSLVSNQARAITIKQKGLTFNNWTNDLEWMDLKPFHQATNSVTHFEYQDNLNQSKARYNLTTSEIAQIEISLNGLFESGKRIFLNTVVLDLYQMATTNNLSKLKKLMTKLYPNNPDLIKLLDQPEFLNAFKQQILIALTNWTSFWKDQWAIANPNFVTNNFLSAANLAQNVAILTTFNLNDQMSFARALDDYWKQVKTRNPNAPDGLQALMQKWFADNKISQIANLWIKQTNFKNISYLHSQYLFEPVSEQTFVTTSKLMIRNAINNLGLTNFNEIDHQQQLNQIVEKIWIAFKNHPDNLKQFLAQIDFNNSLSQLNIDQQGWLRTLFYQIQSQANQFNHQFYTNQADWKILKQWSTKDMFQLADLIMISPMLAHDYQTYKYNPPNNGGGYYPPSQSKPEWENNPTIAITGDQPIGLSAKDINQLGITVLYRFLQANEFNLNAQDLNQTLATILTNDQLLTYNQSVVFDQNQVPQLILDYSHAGFWDQLIFNQNSNQFQTYQKLLKDQNFDQFLITNLANHFNSISSFHQASLLQNDLTLNLINHHNFFQSGKFLNQFKAFKLWNFDQTNYTNPFDLFKPFQNAKANDSNQQAQNWLSLAQVPTNNFYIIANLEEQVLDLNWKINQPIIRYLDLFNIPLINKTTSSTNSTLNNLKNIIKSISDVKQMQTIFKNNFNYLNDKINNFYYYQLMTSGKTISLANIVNPLPIDVGNLNATASLLLPPIVGALGGAFISTPIGWALGAITVPLLSLFNFMNQKQIDIGYWQTVPTSSAVANQNAYLQPDQSELMMQNPNNAFQYRNLDQTTSGVSYNAKQVLDLANRLLTNNDKQAWTEILGTNQQLISQVKPLVSRNLETIVEHQQDLLWYDFNNKIVNHATKMASTGITSTKFIDLNQPFAAFLVNNSNLYVESFNSLNYNNEIYEQNKLSQPVFTSGQFNQQKSYGAAGQFLKFSTSDLLQGMTSAVLSVRNRAALNKFPIDINHQLEPNKIYTVSPTNQLPETGLGGIFDNRSAALKNFEAANRNWNWLPFFGSFYANANIKKQHNRLKHFILNENDLPVIQALPYLPTNFIQKLIIDANGGQATDWQHNLLGYSTLTLQIVKLPNGNAALKVIQEIYDNGSGAYVFSNDPNVEYDQAEALNLQGLSYVSRVLSQPSSQISPQLIKNWIDPKNGIVANVLAKAKNVSLDPNIDLGFNDTEKTQIFKQINPGDFANQAVNALVKNWNQLIQNAAQSLTPEQLGYEAPWFNIDIDNRFEIIKSILATTTIDEIAITWTKVNSTNSKGSLSFEFKFQIAGNILNFDANVITTKVSQIGIENIPVEFSFSQKIEQLLKIVNIQNLTLNTIGFNKQQILRDFYKTNLPDQKLLEQDFKKALRWANDQEVLYEYVNFWTMWINRVGNEVKQFSSDQSQEINHFATAQSNLLKIATTFTSTTEKQFYIDYEALKQANLAFKNNLQQIVIDENIATEFLKQYQQISNQYNVNDANEKVTKAFSQAYLNNGSLITTEDKLKFLANTINVGWANGTTIDPKYQNQNINDQSIELNVNVSDVFSVMVNVNDSVFSNRFSPITMEDKSRNQIFNGKPQADGNYLWEFNATDTTNQLTFTNFTNVNGAMTPNEYIMTVDARHIKELNTVFKINFVQNPANYDNITISNSPSSDFLINGPYSKDWFLAAQQFELSPYNQWNADTFKKLQDQGQLELIFSDDPDQLVSNYFTSQGWDQNHLEVIAYESAKTLNDPTRFNKYLMKNPFKIFKSDHEKQTGTIHDIINVKTPNLQASPNLKYQINDTHYSSITSYQAINAWAPDLLIDLTWLQQSVVDLTNQFQVGDQVVWGEVDPQVHFNDPVIDQNPNQRLVNIDFGLLKQGAKLIVVKENDRLQFQFKPKTLYKLSITRNVKNQKINFNKYVYYTTDSIINISQHNSLNKLAYLDSYFNIPTTNFNEKLQFNQFFDDGSWQMLIHNQALITNNQTTIEQLESQKYDLTLSTLLAIMKNQQALLSQNGANQLDIDVIKRQIVNKIQAVAQFVQQGFGSNSFDILLNNSFLNYIELFNDNQIKQLDSDLNRILEEIKTTKAEIDKLEQVKAQSQIAKAKLKKINATFNQIRALAEANPGFHPDQIAPLPSSFWNESEYQPNSTTPITTLVQPQSLNLWFKMIVVEQALGLKIDQNQDLVIQDGNSGWNALDQLYFEQNQKHLNINTTVKNIYLGFLRNGWFFAKTMGENNQLTIEFKDQQSQNQFNQLWVDAQVKWSTIFNLVEQKTFNWNQSQNQNKPQANQDWILIKNSKSLPDLDVSAPNFNIQKEYNLNKFRHFNNATLNLKQFFVNNPNDVKNLIADPNQSSQSQLVKVGIDHQNLLKLKWNRLHHLLKDLDKDQFVGFKKTSNNEYQIDQKQNGWHFAIPVLVSNQITNNNQDPTSWTIGWQLQPQAYQDQDPIFWTTPGVWIKIESLNQKTLNPTTAVDSKEIKYYVRSTINLVFQNLNNQNSSPEEINKQIQTLVTSWFGSASGQQEDSYNQVQSQTVSPLLSDFTNHPTAYPNWGGQTYFEWIANNNPTLWQQIKNKFLKNINKFNWDWNGLVDTPAAEIQDIGLSGYNFLKSVVETLYEATNGSDPTTTIFNAAYKQAAQAQISFDHHQIRDLINQNTSANTDDRRSISLDQATQLVGNQFAIINQNINQAQQELNFYQNRLSEQQQSQNDLIYEKSQILSQGSSMYLMLSTLFVSNQAVYQKWNDLLTANLPFIDKLTTINTTIKEQIAKFPSDQQLPKMQSVVEQIMAIENDIIKLQQLRQETFYQSSLDPGVAREAALYLLKNVRDITFEQLMNKIFKITNWQGGLGIYLTSNLVSANALWSFEQIKDFDDRIEPLANHPNQLKTKSIQFLGSVFEKNLNKRTYFIISIPLAFASDSPQAISEKFRIFFANDEYINLNGFNQWIEKVMNQPLSTSLVNENQTKLFRTTGAKQIQLANGQSFIHFGYNPFDPQSKPTLANQSSLLFSQSPIYNNYFFKEKTYLATISPQNRPSTQQLYQQQKILNQLSYFQLQTISQFSNFDQIFDLASQNQIDFFAKKDRFFKIATVANTSDAFGQQQYQLIDHFDNQKFTILKDEANPQVNASGQRPGWIYYDRVVLVDQLQSDLNTPSGQKAAIVLTKPKTLTNSQWISFIDNVLNRSFFVANDIITNSVLPTSVKTLLNPILSGQSNLISLAMSDLKLLAAALKFDLKTSAIDPYLSGTANLFSDQNRVIIELAHQNGAQDLITNNKYTLLNLVIKISSKTNTPYVFSPKLILLKNAILEKSIVNQTIVKDFAKFNQRHLFSQLKGLLMNEIQDQFISTTLKTTASSFNGQLSDLNYILETLFAQATYVNFNYRKYFEPILDPATKVIVPMIERVPLIISEIVGDPANSNLFTTLVQQLSTDQPLANIKQILINANVLSFDQSNPNVAQFVINPSYALLSQLNYSSADFKTISLELSFVDLNDPIKAAAKAQGLVQSPLSFDGIKKYLDFKLVENQVVPIISPNPTTFSLSHLLSDQDLKANLHYQNAKILTLLDEVDRLWQTLITTTSLVYQAGTSPNQYQLKVDSTMSGTTTNVKLFYNLEQEDLNLSPPLTTTTLNIDLSQYNDQLLAQTNPQAMTTIINHQIVDQLVKNYTVEGLTNATNHILRVVPLLEPAAMLNGKWIFVVETIQDQSVALSQFIVSGLSAITENNYMLIGTNRNNQSLSLINQNPLIITNDQIQLFNAPIKTYELDVQAQPNSALVSQFSQNLKQTFNASEINQVVSDNQLPRQFNLIKPPTKPEWMTTIPTWAIAIILVLLTTITLGLGALWWRKSYRKSNSQR